jgi:hypothetical protein
MQGINNRSPHVNDHVPFPSTQFITVLVALQCPHILPLSPSPATRQNGKRRRSTQSFILKHPQTARIIEMQAPFSP